MERRCCLGPEASQEPPRRSQMAPLHTPAPPAPRRRHRRWARFGRQAAWRGYVPRPQRSRAAVPPAWRQRAARRANEGGCTAEPAPRECAPSVRDPRRSVWHRTGRLQSTGDSTAGLQPAREQSARERAPASRRGRSQRVHSQTDRYGPGPSGGRSVLSHLCELASPPSAALPAEPFAPPPSPPLGAAASELPLDGDDLTTPQEVVEVSDPPKKLPKRDFFFPPLSKNGGTPSPPDSGTEEPFPICLGPASGRRGGRVGFYCDQNRGLRREVTRAKARGSNAPRPRTPSCRRSAFFALCWRTRVLRVGS